MNTVTIITVIGYLAAIIMAALIFFIQKDFKTSAIAFGILFIFTSALAFAIQSNMIVKNDNGTISFQIPTIQTQEKTDVENNIPNTKIIRFEKIPSSEEKYRIPENTGIIFLGDSRTNGMNITCNFSDDSDKFIVAKDRAGLTWLTTEAYKKINSIAEANDYDTYVVITNMGVNDTDNINGYLEFYKTLSEKYDIILISVNPTNNGATVTNEQIQNFNQKLKESGFYYIDTYSILIDNNFQTTDGVHYTDGTYNMIYNHICNILHIKNEITSKD